MKILFEFSQMNDHLAWIFFPLNTDVIQCLGEFMIITVTALETILKASSGLTFQKLQGLFHTGV